MSGGDAAFERALGPLLELAGLSTAVRHADLLARVTEVVDAAPAVLRVRSVGLILLDEDDRLRVAAATDGAAAALEAAQARLGEGPGIDCMRAATTIAVGDLWAPDGYARLRPVVEGPPMRAVLSSPVRVGESVVGNFNALDPDPHEWAPAQVRANAA